MRPVDGWVFQIPAFHKAHSIYNDRDIARDTSRHKTDFKTKVFFFFSFFRFFFF